MAEDFEHPFARKKRFVLVVDESSRDAYYTGMLLQNFGYNATNVKSAEEALEYLAIALPSLIVTELVLPGMNGFDFLSKLRRDPEHGSIPVIIQTRLQDLESEDHCQQMGCAVYLRKPVQAEDLYRAVQAVMEDTPRRNIRIPVYLKASIDGAGAGTEFVTALSDTGCFIKTLKPRPVGSRHTLSFVVGKKIIRTEVQVLYVYGFDEGQNKEPGMGLKFLNLGPDEHALIRRFIQETVIPHIRPE